MTSATEHAEPKGGATGQSASTADAAAPSGRFALLDQVRGWALYAMAVYHLAWDLAFLELADIPAASHPFWLWFRGGVISVFLLLVGVNLSLAYRRRTGWPRRLRRLALLAMAAGLVSACTRAIAPGNWVFFGILHCIVAAGLVLPPICRLPAWVAAAAGAGVILLDRIALPAFDAVWLWWVGLGTSMPPTLDYVPLVPWFGPILLGIAVGRLLFADDKPVRIPIWRPRSLGLRVTGFFGRYSLAFYLLHQPILLAPLYGWLWLST